MPKRLEVNIENASIEELEDAMKASVNISGFKRLQAIFLMYDGLSIQEFSSLHKLPERTVRSWVSKFNLKGIDGLAQRGKSGRPRKIAIDKFQAEYLPIILSPKLVGEDSFTAIKFYNFIKEEHKEELCYQTLLNYYHENNLSLVVPRPCVLDKQDEERRAEFINKIKELAGEKKELWFSDEVGFEGDPRPRARWVKVGSKPINGRASEHLRFSAIGAINPLTGEHFSLIFPGVDQEVFQVYLEQLSEATNKREIHLILDNASWHKCKGLNWYNIQPVFLPPYSPDYNPIENLWRFMKINHFNGWYAKNIEQLIERICLAFNSLTPEQIKNTTNPQYLFK